jgi:hypothetical protein
MRASAPLAAAALTLAVGAAAAQAAFPGDNGKIAYTFWDSGQTNVSAFELRVRRPGAKQPTTIYRCVYGFDVQDDPPCHELRDPSWSPDGELIAATELGPGESGGERLVILRADGSELRRLPPLTSVEKRRGGRRQTEHDPAWSPDGSRLVFAGLTGFDDLDGRRWNLDVYVVNADGTGLRRLTRARAGMARPPGRRGRAAAGSPSRAIGPAARTCTRCDRTEPISSGSPFEGGSTLAGPPTAPSLPSPGAGTYTSSAPTVLACAS